MRTKFSGFLTLLLALTVQLTFAQQRTITGTVTDSDGLPLPGVNIVVKGTNNGTQTDFDGNYDLNASPSDVLVFSFVSFKTQEQNVGQRRTIDVAMQVDSAELEEVVVQGYRTSTKEKSSISSVTISNKTIENRPNASFVQTLSGQVAGLQITTQSGQPGGNSLVQLRGVNSINGNTEPLFIIDGAIVDEDNFRSLNPQDIASISVLKDAGATAIYGNRGANGVVVIETRQGGYEQALQVNATSIVSFNTLQDNDFRLMNSQQQLLLERQQNSGRGASLTDAEIAAATTTDWLDVFFRTGVTQNNTVTLSSGSKNATQYTSLGYFDTQGILVQSGLQRFNIRNNVTGKSDNGRFNYGTNLSLNYSTNNIPNFIGSGAINRNYILAGLQSVPYISPDDLVSGQELADRLQFVDTPLFLLDRLQTFERSEDEVKLIGSINASYKITDELTAAVTASADYESQLLLRQEESNSFNARLFGGGANPLAGTQDQQFTRQFAYNQVTSLNYNKTFGKSTIDATIYTEYFKAHLRTLGFRARGLDDRTSFPGDGSGFVDDNSDNDFFVDTANANILSAGLFSYFGSFDYDYDAKYGFYGVVRRDASYRFAESNRYATFYSLAGRWNISNEEFMEGSIFDVLKLRASYGTAGNQRIVDGGYFSAPDLTLNLFATGGGYAGQNSIFLSQIGNSTLRWETVTQTNVGVDFEVFDRRLRGAVDVYFKETTDLFQSTPISAINSQTSIQANTGSLTNKGVDFTLNYDAFRNPDGFNLGFTFVGNYNENELTELPSDNGIIEGTGRVGGPIGEIQTIRYAGVNPANGNLLFLTADGDLTEQPDADNDRVFIGKNILPDFNGSFGFNASYKGFFVQTNFTYVIGVDRFAGDYSTLVNADNIGQFRTSTDLLRAWTPDNRVTDIPSLNATNDNTFGSTRFLRSADYVRLRFASIGYDVPKDYLNGTGLARVRVFANAENAITFTEWRALDVEQRSGARSFPTPRTFSLGVELGL